MLEIESLTKRYGDVTALNQVDIKVRPGEMIAVVGRSGAGKSTLLRCLNRLETPNEGKIRYKDDDVTALKGKQLNAWRAHCAMIFQQFQLVPRLDVLTNVLIGGLRDRPFVSSMTKHFPASERARAIVELGRLGMEKTAMQRAGTLSGGQQQRVAIARAMMQRPEILLADEPIASLDPRNAHAVMQTLADINKRRGITILVNLHAVDIARDYCKRVIGLRDGELVFDAPTAELTDDALQHIYDGEAHGMLADGQVKKAKSTSVESAA